MGLVLAGSHGGGANGANVFRSVDDGQNWTDSLPFAGQTAGSATFIHSILHIGAGVVLANMNSNNAGDRGVWRSTDNGMTFTQTALGGNGKFLNVGNGIILRIGSGTCYRSTDFGVTWDAGRGIGGVGDNDYPGVYLGNGEIIVARGWYRPKMYQFTYNTGTIHRSLDYGDTWSQIAIVPGVTGAGAIAHVTGTDILYCGTQTYTGSNDYQHTRVYRSTDRGVTWSLQSQPWGSIIGLVDEMFYIGGDQIVLALKREYLSLNGNYALDMWLNSTASGAGTWGVTNINLFPYPSGGSNSIKPVTGTVPLDSTGATIIGGYGNSQALVGLSPSNGAGWSSSGQLFSKNAVYSVTSEFEANLVPSDKFDITLRYKQAGGSFADVTSSDGHVGSNIWIGPRVAYWTSPYTDRGGVEISDAEIEIIADPDPENENVRSLNITSVTQMDTPDAIGSIGDVKVEYEIA